MHRYALGDDQWDKLWSVGDMVDMLETWERKQEAKKFARSSWHATD